MLVGRCKSWRAAILAVLALACSLQCGTDAQPNETISIGGKNGIIKRGRAEKEYDELADVEDDHVDTQSNWRSQLTQNYWMKNKIMLRNATILPADRVDKSQAHKCLMDGFHPATESKDFKVFSQNGEDGILVYVFSCIGITNKFYVEFGTEDGSECNSRFFRERLNWTGLLMDGGFSNSTINLRRANITAENIADLLHKYEVPHPNFDLLSIDIDLNTWWVLRAILAAGYRPRVIIAEINRTFKPDQAYAAMYLPEETWNSNEGENGATCYFGASALAYERLCRAFGYSPVTVDSQGVNMVFVLDETIGEIPMERTIAEISPESPFASTWWHIHGPCANTAWLAVGEDVPFARPGWQRSLVPVVMKHNWDGGRRGLYETSMRQEMQLVSCHALSQKPPGISLTPRQHIQRRMQCAGKRGGRRGPGRTRGGTKVEALNLGATDADTNA